MKFIKKATLLILLTILLGCESIGIASLNQETELSISQKIIVGRTTKNEIQTMFNSATFSSFDTGLEVWKYELSESHSEIDMSGTSVDIYGTPNKAAENFPPARHIKKHLVIIFDENGVVKKYSYSSLPAF